MPNDFIYYPWTEVKDENWLKFALLYLDKLIPIVPPSAPRSFDLSYQMVSSDTDLIQPVMPNLSVASRAAVYTIDLLEDFLSRPKNYEFIFGNNYFTQWTTRDFQNNLIYEDKYTYGLERFCIENKLGHRATRGIKVGTDVAQLFMSVLAENMADDLGKGFITDETRIESIIRSMKRPNKQSTSTLELAKCVINIKLPDIYNIDLSKIVSLRNNNHFRSHLRYFHDSLSGISKDVEILNGLYLHDAIARYELDSILTEITRMLSALGPTIMQMGLSFWAGYDPANLPKSIGLSLATGVIQAYSSKDIITDAYYGIKQWKGCKSYLADLSSLREALPAL